MLPQYGISRLITRIEKEKYLKRVDCVEAGRGQHLRITKSGQTLRKKMWRVYGNAIEESIGEKLTAKQRRDLAGLLRNLVTVTQCDQTKDIE